MIFLLVLATTYKGWEELEEQYLFINLGERRTGRYSLPQKELRLD